MNFFPVRILTYWAEYGYSLCKPSCSVVIWVSTDQKKTLHLDTFYVVPCCIFETELPVPYLNWCTFSCCISSLFLHIFLYDTSLLKIYTAIFSDGVTQLTLNETTRITLCMS